MFKIVDVKDKLPQKKDRNVEFYLKTSDGECSVWAKIEGNSKDTWIADLEFDDAGDLILGLDTPGVDPIHHIVLRHKDEQIGEWGMTSVERWVYKGDK